MRTVSLTFIVWLAMMAHCDKNKRNPPVPPGGMEITDTIIAGGLSHIWELVWGPDNYLWITERGGRISRVNPTTGSVIPLLTIAEVASVGEGGLLGMVLHPNFSTTPHVFVAYNYYSGSNYREKIVRFTYNGSTLINPVTILDNIMAASIHNGCRLLISPDMKLFITTGDAANANAYPQNISHLNGKVLRLNLDSSIPADNPFPNNPVWSYGHRNAQGLVLAGNVLFVSEHGPANDDEINIIEKGRNYGWPQVEGYCNSSSEQNFCTANNVKEPIMAWTPTIAPCGLAYYNNDEIPQWKNSLLLVALKNARLYQLKLNTDMNSITETNEYFTSKYGRMRSVCISPAGKVYIGTSNGGNDRIVEIRKK
jgi:glucose/arabinose dehydrogenase